MNGCCAGKASLGISGSPRAGRPPKETPFKDEDETGHGADLGNWRGCIVGGLEKTSSPYYSRACIKLQRTGIRWNEYCRLYVRVLVCLTVQSILFCVSRSEVKMFCLLLETVSSMFRV